MDSSYVLRCAVVGCILLLTAGCGVHYYDRRTGVEHVWGFGHMKMKAAPVAEHLDSVVAGTRVAGISLGVGREQYYVTAGWDDRRRIVVGTNVALALEWPDADFFNVRLGTNPPFLKPDGRYSVRTNE